MAKLTDSRPRTFRFPSGSPTGSVFIWPTNDFSNADAIAAPSKTEPHPFPMSVDSPQGCRQLSIDGYHRQEAPAPRLMVATPFAPYPIPQQRMPWNTLMMWSL